MSGIILGGEQDFPRRFAALEQMVLQLARQQLLNNGQLIAASSLYLNAGPGSGGSVVVNPDGAGAAQVNGNLAVSGAFTVTGTKSFLMPHPTDPTKSLQHAATESPQNGVEYWGASAIPAAASSVVVTLPAYFDALTQGQPTLVFVTPQAPSPPPSPYTPPQLSAGPYAGGSFTVYGPAGTSFSWLVKSTRVHLVGGVDALAFQPVEALVSPPPAAPTMPS